MKKETTKWTSSIEDITIEQAVNEFFDFEDWRPNDWDYTVDTADFYIEDSFIEISEKEKELLKIEIEKEFDKRVNKIRQEEVDQLKDRKSILNWIESIIQYDYPNEGEGEVGYMLSKEEILDLILQNGNK